MIETHPDLEPLLTDEPSPRRESVLRHVRDCARCRGELTALDPSRLFGLLALERVPQAALERLSREVGRSIDVAEGVPGRFRRAIASIAASLLLAGVFGAYVWQREDGREAPTAPPTARARPVEAAEPAFELLSSSEAQVVDLSVGDVQLVMIFDEGFDL